MPASNPLARPPNLPSPQQRVLEARQAIPASELGNIPGPNKPTCASQYGGPSDRTSGTKGYKGDTLTGTMAFAELGMGTALGNLPYKSKMSIEYNGKIITAEKLDIGAGGPGCGGYPRTIDLWWETAQALGFSGLGVVKYNTPYTAAELQKAGKEKKKNPCEVKTGVPVVGGGIDKVAQGFCEAGLFFKEAAKFFEFITSSSGWLRIGKVVLGAGLLVIALSELTKISPEASTIADPAKKAVGVAVTKKL